MSTMLTCHSPCSEWVCAFVFQASPARADSLVGERFHRRTNQKPWVLYGRESNSGIEEDTKDELRGLRSASQDGDH